MRVLPPRTARLLYRSLARARRTTRRHHARLHAEDVHYVLVSELSKKKAAVAGRLAMALVRGRLARRHPAVQRGAA